MTSLKKASVQTDPNVQNSDILSMTIPMINRMKVEEKSEKTITSYVRAVEKLVRFHHLVHPRELDIDEVMDFLVSLNEKEKINWWTSKMYVAGLRYYWRERLEDDDCADRSCPPASRFIPLYVTYGHILCKCRDQSIILKNILASLRHSAGKNFRPSLPHVTNYRDCILLVNTAC